MNKKTELANHKISLNLQADINKVLDEVEDSLQELGMDAAALDEASFEVKKAIDEFSTRSGLYKQSAKNAESYIMNGRQLKKKIEEIAKDLGVDPSGVKNYKLLNDYTQDLAQAVADVPTTIKDFSNFNF